MIRQASFLALTGPLLVLESFLPSALAGQVTARYTIPSTVALMLSQNPDILIASRESGLFGVDPATGAVRWARPDLTNTSGRRMAEVLATKTLASGVPAPLTVPQLVLQGVNGTRFGLITSFAGRTPGRAELLDLGTGFRQWDSRAVTTEDVMGVVPIPGDSLLLMIVRPTQSSDSSIVMGVELLSGAVRWRRTDVFSRLPGFQFPPLVSGLRSSVADGPPPIKDTDSTVVLFLSREEVVKIDLRDGKKLWSARLPRAFPPPSGDGHADILLSHGVLFVPFASSLAAIDTQTGEVLWNVSLPGKVDQLVMISAGLLVRGSPILGIDGRYDGKPFLDLLEIITGSSRWTEVARRNRYSSNVLVSGSHAFAGHNGGLYVISLDTGQPTLLANLHFEDQESPRGVEWLEDDVFAFSKQNLARVDTAGLVKYHQYIQPPSSFVEHWTTRVCCGSVVMLAKAVGPDKKNGMGLVRMAKSTGEIVSRLPVHDRAPEYIVDSTHGLIFVFDHDDTVSAYPF
jgi:hypothetical protein